MVAFLPVMGVGQVASAKVHPVVVFNICDRYAARRDRPTLRARLHRGRALHRLGMPTRALRDFKAVVDAGASSMRQAAAAALAREVKAYAVVEGRARAGACVRGTRGPGMPKFAQLQT